MFSLKRSATRFLSWLQDHRFAAVGLCMVLFLFSATPAHAQSAFDILSGGTQALVNIIVTGLAFILNVIGFVLGKIIVLIMGMLIIPILGYNGFADASIVDIGWPLVRDLVNMAVIVVLLVIAIKTMIGSQNANWQQQLPRLFLAVVAVNFSRTIVLLVIDASQVVMMTFVNALRDIAAGNMVQMFGLQGFFSLNTENLSSVVEADPSAAALDSVGYLATGYATIVFLGAVLAVLGLLAIVYIYRIILLWVLLIMAPLAFFAGGIRSIIPQAGQAYSSWMEKLVGAAVLGPLLTFFLWLGLAAAAEGSIAASEGFPTNGTEDIPTLLSEAFNIEQLLGLFLGLILIMVGFQIAGSTAGKMGSVAGGLINANVGKTLVKNAVKAPASLAYRGARQAGRQALIRDQQGKQIFSGMAESFMNTGQKIEDLNIPGSRMAGRAVRRLGGSTIQGIEGVEERAREVAAERNANVSLAERVEDMWTIDDPSKVMMLSDRMVQEGNMQELLTNKEMRKTLRDSAESKAASMVDRRAIFDRADDMDFESDEERRAWVEKEYEARVDEQADELYGQKMQQAFAWAEKNESRLDDKKDEFERTRNEHLRYLSPAEIEEAINDPDFDSKYRRYITAEDLRDGKVIDAMSSRVVKTETDRYGNEIVTTLLDEVAAGKGVGTKARDAAQGKGVDFSNLGDDMAKAIGQALRHENLEVKDLTLKDLQDDQGNIDDAKTGELADAFAHANVDLGDIPSAVRDVVEARLAQKVDTVVDAEANRRYRKAAFSATNDTEKARQQLEINVDGTFASQDGKTMTSEIVVDQPTQVYKLDVAVDEGTSSDLTRIIESRASNATADNLGRLFQQAEGKGSTEVMDRIRKSATTYRKAIQAEMEQAIQTVMENSDEEIDRSEAYRRIDDRLKSKLNKFRSLERVTQRTS